MPNTNTLNRRNVKEKKAKSTQQAAVSADPISPESSHSTAAERHLAKRGKVPPPEAFERNTQSAGISRGKAGTAKGGRAEAFPKDKRSENFAGTEGRTEKQLGFPAQESREQTPQETTAPRFAEGRPPSEGKMRKIKELPARALENIKGSKAAASMRSTVNKGLESRPVKAIKSHPARAGLIAAGVAGLAIAGTLGVRAIKKKRAGRSKKSGR